MAALISAAIQAAGPSGVWQVFAAGKAQAMAGVPDWIVSATDAGAKVDINDDGVIKIASANADSIKKAYDMIYSIVAEPEEGKVYTGKVVKLVDFGAFVNFFGKRDGLVHVSQLAPRRVNKVTDVVKEGDKVKVKLLGMDERGKVRLSMKAVDQATGEDIEGKQRPEGGEQPQAAQGGAE